MTSTPIVRGAPYSLLLCSKMPEERPYKAVCKASSGFASLALRARRRKRIDFVAVSLSLILMACSAPMPKRPSQGVELGDLAYLTARLDWEAAQLLDAGAASLTLAIFDADGVFWEKGYGLADVANEILAVPSTLYRVGSISKLFTATAIMQLVAKGDVILDAPLTTYLPEFNLRPPPPILPGAAQWQLSDITIRSMLTHQSGIPTNVLKGYVSNHPIPFTEYVNVIRGWRAQAPVGLAFGYSNVAVTLLGHVVQRVSGVPFSEYIQKNILMPAGMPTSSFEATPEILATVARSYLAGDEIEAKKIGIIPAGALFSNVQELATFGRMALRGGLGVRGRVLETVDLESMWTRQNADVALDYDFEFGLGWWLNPIQIAGSGLQVGHNGGLIAHRSFLLLLPDRELGVVALTNTGETSIEEMGALALRLALEARTGVTDDALTNDDSTGHPALSGGAREVTSRDPDELEVLAGVYSTMLGDFEIHRHRDSLRTERLILGSSVEFRPSVGDLFRPRFRVFDLIPYSPSELDDLAVGFGRVGEVDTLFFDEGGQTNLAGWRISPSPVSAAWRARIGRYEIVNLGTDFAFMTGLELSLKEDRLRAVLHSDDWWTLPIGAYLEPLTDDEACTWSLGGSICIHADESGDEVELELSGYRLRLAK